MATKNYFSYNIEQFGKDFIRQKSPYDIQKDARKRIFKDMIYGNIDYSKYGEYFTDHNFLDNLIIEANIENDKHRISAQALYEYDINHHGNPITSAIASNHQHTSFILSIILNSLNSIKMDPVMNIAYLNNIADACYKYRSDFNEFY